jgi:Ca2+-binding RTX toxin-like protein
VSDGDSCES